MTKCKIQKENTKLGTNAIQFHTGQNLMQTWKQWAKVRTYENHQYRQSIKKYFSKSRLIKTMLSLNTFRKRK